MKGEMSRLSEKSTFMLWVCGIIFLIWTSLQIFLLFWYGLPFPQSLIDSTVSGFIFAISSYIISTSLHFYQPGKERYGSLLVWVIMLAALSTYCTKTLIDWIFDADLTYQAFVRASLPLRYIASFLLIGCTAILNVLWNSQQNQSEQEKRRTDAEKMTREAELYNLRQQLQPHFLFNSLNSIVALISIEPERAKQMVFQLSDFLRGTLRKDDQQLISIQEEMEHLQLYLDIEKVRFGHRLKIEIDMPNEDISAFLPAMIVQPLLENAIKYGLYDNTDQVNIGIQVTLTHAMLDIQITNPYDQETSCTTKSSGFGLRSVQRRLYLLYGRTDLLQTKNENSTFFAHLKIPQQHD